MVIEWLSVRVPRDLQARFLEVDAGIWTPVLAAQPGFVSKETWRDPEDPNALVLVIHWESLAHWKAISAQLLAQTEQRFTAEMGQAFAFLETKTFEVAGE
jgi:uncharacterized protein (TIGR03792 family)